ncbi:MAG: DUF2293 domain-containing protein [Euryarchaeota archaeon]|nr:DUF2293 domain-containing protein [Euryarchaeota archaeon]
MRGLPVWHSREREGYRSPEYGEVEVPKGWVFLPSGDAFVTRQTKMGLHWVLLKRRKGYTATLGILCPEESVQQAKAKAAQTQGAREAQRETGKRSRARAEERYRTQLEQAILSFLAFAPKHEPLAREIARGAVSQATPVGSGRVGRTKKLALEERAELAARAYIRHKHTDYEERLNQRSVNPWDEVGEDDHGYREVKSEANRKVTRFLTRYRP